MIGEFLHPALPFTAASDIAPLRPVKITTANRTVVLAATNNDYIHGFVGDATALRTEAVTAYGPGAVVQAVAVASLGAGGVMGVGSVNGDIGPVAAASGIVRYSVGIALESAAAGEKFSLYVNPRQLPEFA